MTHRPDEQERVALTEAQALLALRFMPVPIAVFVDGAIRVVSDALADMLGTDHDDLIGRFGDRVLSSETAARVRSSVEASRLQNEPATEDVDFFTLDGRVVPVRVVIRATVLAGRPATLAVIHDRSDEMRRTSDLEHRAHIDPMTGLLRREVILDEIERALARAARSGTRTAVMFIDLDGLKRINDERGHAAGDLVIGAVAGRLRAVTRPGDHVGRYGGDEFLVLAEQVETEAAEAMARRIGAAVAQPLIVFGREVTPSAAVGVAVGPEAHGHSAALVRRADDAMYDAKRAGPGAVRVAGP